MDNKEFDRLLGLWKKEKMSRAKGVLPAKGKDCLFFTELEAYVNNGCQALTAFQKQHIESCSYCQRMIATFKETMEEEEQTTPIYARIKEIFNAFLLPFKTLPRFAPALVPVLTVIIIFIIFPPLFNPSLELKNYSFEFSQSTLRTRGSHLPTGKISKIKLTVNLDCYAYLFTIEENKARLLIQEKVMGKVENAFPKEGRFEEEGKLILLLTKKPLQDTSSAGEIIIKNYDKDEKTTLEALRRQLKRKDIGIKFLNISKNK